jgi:predicted Zn-dependent protease
MRYIFLGLCCFFFSVASVLNAESTNQKALKYLKLCLRKTNSKYLFDRLYDSWSEEDANLGEYLESKFKETKNTDYLRLLVRFYEKEGLDDKALKVCGKLLEKNPGDPELLLTKGQIEFYSHSPEDAVKDLTQALQAKGIPKSLEINIRKMLGRAYLRLGKEKQALAIWKEMYAKSGDVDLGEEVLQLMQDEGLYAEAAKLCAELLKKSRDPYRKNELAIRLADIYRLKGDRKKAISEYTVILKKTGSGTWLEKELFSRIAQVYREQDDVAGLLKFTKNFLTENKGRIELRRKYVTMLDDSGKTKEAFQEFLGLLKQAPLNREFRLDYARMLTAENRKADAAGIYTVLLKRFPKDSELYFAKAAIELSIPNKKQGLADVEKYLQISGKSEFAYNRVAKLLRREKLNSEAGKFLRKSYELFPKSSDAVEAYAEWLLGSKQEKQGIELLTNAKGALSLEDLLRRVRLLIRYKQGKEAYTLLFKHRTEFDKKFRFNEEIFALANALKKSTVALNTVPAMVETAQTWEELNRAISSAMYMLGREKQKTQYMDSLKSKALSSNMSCLLAVLMADAGEPQKAFNLLDAELKKYPEQKRLYRQKAALLERDEKFVEAGMVFRELLRRDQSNRTVYYRKLIALDQKADKMQEALQWAMKLQKEFPDAVDSWLVLADAYKKAGKTSDEVKSLRRAAFRFPDSRQVRERLMRAYTYSRDYQGAVNVCWKILRKESKLSAKLSMIKQIFQLSRMSGNKQVVESRLRRMMKNDPKNIFPLLALAQLAKMDNNYGEYRRYLQKAMLLRKDDVNLLYELALTEEDDGAYAAAEATLKKACELDKSGKAVLKLADFYFRNGEDEKALGIYAKNIVKSGSLKSLINGAASMLQRKQPEAAIDMLRSVRTSNPDNFELRYVLGCSYEEKGDYGQAANEFLAAFRLVDKLQSAGRQISQFANYYSLNVSDEFDRLMAIRQNFYNAYRYRHQQPSYRGYAYFSPFGMGFSFLPGNRQNAEAMLIAHLGNIYRAAEPKMQKKILEEMKLQGINNPEFKFTVASQNFYNLDVRQAMDKYKGDFDVILFLCVNSANRMATILSPEEFRKLFNKLKKKNEKYPFVLLSVTFNYNNVGSSENRRLVLNWMKKQKNLSATAFYPLISYFSRGVQNQIDKSELKLIKDILLSHYKEFLKDSKTQNMSRYYIASVICGMVKLGDYAAAVKLLQEESMRSQTQKQGIAYPYAMPYYHGRGGLQFRGLTFPPNRVWAMSSPLIVMYQQRLGSQLSEEQKKKFWQACKVIMNPESRLLLADMCGATKDAESAADKLAADKKSKYSQLLLVAAWYGKQAKISKAVACLIKAEKFAKDKAQRKIINCAIIGYAMLAKDSKSVMPQVREASKKLLRLRLTISEKASLAEALQGLGLEKEAARIDDALLKKGSNDGAAITGGRPTYRPSSQDIYQKIDKLLKGNNVDKGIKLAAREYRKQFRTFYNQTMSIASNFYEPYQVRRIVDLVKRSKAVEEFLATLKPADNASMLKLCEYAWACNKLNKKKIALEYFKKAASRVKNNRFVNLQTALVSLDSSLPDKNMLKELKVQDLIMLSNRSYQLFRKNPEMLIRFYRLFVDKLKGADLKKIIDSTQGYQYNNVLHYLEQGYYFDKKGNIPSIFNKIPEKLKPELKKICEERVSIYLELCDCLMSSPITARNAFGRKLMLLKCKKMDTSKMFEQGLKVIELLAKNPISYSHYRSSVYINGKNSRVPDVDDYVTMTALTTGRLPKLMKVIEKLPSSARIKKKIAQLEKLYKCPANKFIEIGTMFVKSSINPVERVENMQFVISVYETRKLTVDLNPMVFAELKGAGVGFQGVHHDVGFIVDWADVAVKLKNTDIILAFIGGLNDSIMKTFKKEFPSGKIDNNRFHQVFNWNLMHAFQRVLRQVVNDKPELWYGVYSKIHEITQIPMLCQRFDIRNSFHNVFYKNGLEALKVSPFIKELPEFRFCSVDSQNLSSMLQLFIENNRYGAKKKKIIEALDKAPNFGTEFVKAALDAKHANDLFACMNKYDAAFKKLPLDKQKQFCEKLAKLVTKLNLSTFNMNSGDSGWKFYQLYSKLLKGDAGKEIEKFSKVSTENPWDYCNQAAELIVTLAQNKPEDALKVWKIADRKLRLRELSNSGYSPRSLSRQLINRIREKSRTLPALAMLYHGMLQNKVNNFNEVKQFYYQLDSCGNYFKRNYSRRKIDRDKLRMIQIQDFFKQLNKNFNMPDPPAFYRCLHNMLRNLKIGQLKELIARYSIGKAKTKVEHQIALALKAEIELKEKRTVSSKTAAAMCEYLKNKKFSDAWRVAAGESLLEISGCQIASVYIAEPLVKMGIRNKRNFNFYTFVNLINKLNAADKTGEWQKAAGIIVDFCMSQYGRNISNMRSNGGRNAMAFLTLCCLAGKEKAAGQLLDDGRLKLKQNFNTAIALANGGNEKLLFELLQKNGTELTSNYRIILTALGRKTADKALAEIADSQTQYLLKIMFASIAIRKYDNSGRPIMNRTESQKKLLGKLASEFKISNFKDKNVALKCAGILVHRFRNNTELKKLILDLKFADLMKLKNLNIIWSFAANSDSLNPVEFRKKYMPFIEALKKCDDDKERKLLQKGIEGFLAALSGKLQRAKSISTDELKEYVRDINAISAVGMADSSIQSYAIKFAFLNFLNGSADKYLKDIDKYNLKNLQAYNFDNEYWWARQITKKMKLDGIEKYAQFIFSNIPDKLLEKRRRKDLPRYRSQLYRRFMQDTRSSKTKQAITIMALTSMKPGSKDFSIALNEAVNSFRDSFVKDDKCTVTDFSSALIRFDAFVPEKTVNFFLPAIIEGIKKLPDADRLKVLAELKKVPVKNRKRLINSAIDCLEAFNNPAQAEQTVKKLADIFDSQKKHNAYSKSKLLMSLYSSKPFKAVIKPRLPEILKDAESGIKSFTDLAGLAAFVSSELDGAEMKIASQMVLRIWQKLFAGKGSINVETLPAGMVMLEFLLRIGAVKDAGVLLNNSSSRYKLKSYPSSYLMYIRYGYSKQAVYELNRNIKYFRLYSYRTKPVIDDKIAKQFNSALTQLKDDYSKSLLGAFVAVISSQIQKQKTYNNGLNFFFVADSGVYLPEGFLNPGCNLSDAQKATAGKIRKQAIAVLDFSVLSDKQTGNVMLLLSRYSFIFYKVTKEMSLSKLKVVVEKLYNCGDFYIYRNVLNKYFPILAQKAKYSAICLQINTILNEIKSGNMTKKFPQVSTLRIIRYMEHTLSYPIKVCFGKMRSNTQVPFDKMADTVNKLFDMYHEQYYAYAGFALYWVDGKSKEASKFAVGFKGRNYRTDSSKLSILLPPFAAAVDSSKNEQQARIIYQRMAQMICSKDIRQECKTLPFFYKKHSYMSYGFKRQEQGMFWNELLRCYIRDKDFAEAKDLYENKIKKYVRNPDYLKEAERFIKQIPADNEARGDK